MQTNFNPAGATATGSQYNSGSPTEGGNEYHVGNESGNNQLRLHVNPDGSSELFRKTENGWESEKQFSKQETENLVLNTGKGTDSVEVTGFVGANANPNITVKTDGDDDQVSGNIEVDSSGTNAEVTAPEGAPAPEASAPQPETAPAAEPGSGGEAPAAPGSSTEEGATTQQPASLLSSVGDDNNTTNTYSDGTVQTTSNNADGSSDVNTQYTDGSSMTASYDENGQLEQMSVTPAADGTSGMAGAAATAGGAPAAPGSSVEEGATTQPGAINPGDPATLSPAEMTQNQINNQLVAARAELTRLLQEWTDNPGGDRGGEHARHTINEALKAVNDLSQIVLESSPEGLAALIESGALDPMVASIGRVEYKEERDVGGIGYNSWREIAIPTPELDSARTLLSKEGYQAALAENAATQTPVNPLTGEPTAAEAPAPTPTTAPQTNASSSSGAINYNGVNYTEPGIYNTANGTTVEITEENGVLSMSAYPTPTE